MLEAEICEIMSINKDEAGLIKVGDFSEVQLGGQDARNGAQSTPSSRVQGMGDRTPEETETILSLWFRTFRHFEYRKVSRLHSGGRDGGIADSFLPSLLLISWIVDFALQNLTIDSTTRTLTLTFATWDAKQQSSPTQSEIFLFIGLGLTSLALILILIVIFWKLRYQTEIVSGIMVISTIALLVIRSYQQSSSTQDLYGLNLAYLSVQFVTAGLIADVICYNVWTAYLLPGILRWQWSQIQTGSNSFGLHFPYWRLFVFLLFALVVLPLWLLIVGSYLLFFLLQLAGIPFFGRNAFEFLTLYRNSWSLSLHSYKLKHRGRARGRGRGRNRGDGSQPGGGLDFLHITVYYRFAAWRTALTPLLPYVGASFTYRGQVNAEGLPHGLGTYRDSEAGGEFIEGQWCDGLPVAPFASREQRQSGGGTFAATRIGFMYVSDAPIDVRSHSLAFRQEPLFGVSSTEGCVTGTFYAEFPNAGTMLTPLRDCSFELAWRCLMDVSRGNDDKEGDEDEENGIGGGGGGGGGEGGGGGGLVLGQRSYEYKEDYKEEAPPLRSDPNLIPSSQWMAAPSTTSTSASTSTSPSLPSPPSPVSLPASTQLFQTVDVLIFVPGYNSTLLSTLELLGQMLLLNAMPSNIVPFCFKWPGGNFTAYRRAQQVCEGAEIVARFDTLVGSLLATGQVRRIHLLGHSMGCRALVNILVTSRFSGFGQCILAQPEVDLSTFRERCGVMARSVANLTVYVNRGDVALWGAELFNRIFAVYDGSHEAEGEADAATACSDEEEGRETMGFASCPSMGRGCCGRPHPSLGRASAGPLLDAYGSPASCDVVDTSSMHSNVNEIRHSFFHLSRETLEDIRQIVVEGSSAKHRKGRLVLRSNADFPSNIFDVCVAPNRVR